MKPLSDETPLKFLRLADESLLWHDAQGLNLIYDFGRGVALHVRRGIISGKFAQTVIKDGERHLAESGRFVLMVDGAEARMHTTDFRETMTSWFRAHEAATVHMLIRSKVLEMALNVANLALGNRRARAYFDVNLWEAAGRGFVPSFERRPLSLPPELGGA